MGGKESKESKKSKSNKKNKEFTDKKINDESDQPDIVHEDEELNNENEQKEEESKSVEDNNKSQLGEGLENDKTNNVDEDSVSDKGEASIEKQQEDEEYWGTADPYADTRRKNCKPPVRLDPKKIEEEANKLDINKHLVTGFTRFHVNTGVLGVPTYDYNFQKINFKETSSSDTRLKSLKKSRFSWQINDMDDEVY